MKYFVISDIHGYFDEMMRDLKSSGYDENDLDHHLIVVGDLGDRGPKAKEVYEYLYEQTLVEKATVIKGNHDEFLINMFERNFGRVYFDIKYNGFGKTLESFLGIKVTMDTDIDLYHSEFYTTYEKYYKWLKGLPYFFELGPYIFVHGGIDGSLLNWRDTSLRDMVWSKEYDQPGVPSRIVVAGHQRVATIRSKSKNYQELYHTNPELFDILYLKDKILIDGFVEVSKKINVLIIEI